MDNTKFTGFMILLLFLLASSKSSLLRLIIGYVSQSIYLIIISFLIPSYKLKSYFLKQQTKLIGVNLWPSEPNLSIQIEF